jgi:hypothetical protein
VADSQWELRTNLLRDELLAQPYPLRDEISVQVLNDAGKAPEPTSYLWAQMSAAPEALTERPAYDAGYPDFALQVSLSEVGFYRRLSYQEAGCRRVTLNNGLVLPVVQMFKSGA